MIRINVYDLLSIEFTTNEDFSSLDRGRRGRDRMVVGFTTTYAISAYHN